ncbi:30S ribosomal protein S15 [Candidatus Aerophobetes bacterium Ae_b3a]|uniref:Small ribosomal subunit protein uS15 n=1 Tax=Aerophobetes bacterium TaxID=2030807 RepID=A0A523ZHK2_UNCAE|nr:MAG: 30S ribosomal protein S15 [Candidatus Aerophobetes bacterium]TKJ47430.1 MAG: 30S ribosomal protein S15 [Candidatus Aerophobetes bacterium Ae_b3a]
MSIDKVKKKELREKFGYHPTDSGSSEVQIAVLSERIKNLTGHLSNYKKDQSAKKGLLQLVMQRRKLLDYLKNENIEKYRKIIKALGLKR